MHDGWTQTTNNHDAKDADRMKRLIITEKHSTAKPFIQVLGLGDASNVTSGRGGSIGYVKGTHDGDEWFVTWCFGHLVETCMPDEYDDRYKRWNLDDLPIIPDKWKYKPVGRTAPRRQLSIIKRLVRDEGFDCIYHAADSDREGELLGREVLRECGVLGTTRRTRKTPRLMRVWYGSVTVDAIRKALEKAEPLNEYDGLGDAGDARQKIDWLYGINLTRAYTSYYHETRNVGRVVSPTINLVVSRQAEIDSFVPQDYAVVSAIMEREGDSFIATARFDDVKVGELVARSIKGHDGTITDIQTKRHSKSVLLYDLTEFQSTCSKLYKLEPSDTMAVMQRLYEQGLVTYPRTSSNTITPNDVDDVTPLVPQVIEGMLGGTVAMSSKADVSRMVSLPGSEDKEASHTGICPTQDGIAAFVSGTLTNTKHERDMFLLIASRMAEACMPPCVMDTTSVTVDIDGHSFSANGHIVIDEGYRTIHQMLGKKLGVTVKASQDKTLPEMSAGETWLVADGSYDLRKTEPPKQYTTASLLDTMKNITRLLPEKSMRDAMRAQDAGLGTSASRDQVIATMKRNGFVTQDEKGYLHPTERSVELMGMLPDAIKTPVMTASLEASLTEVASGRETEDNLLASVIDIVRKDVDVVKSLPRQANTYAKATYDAKVIVKDGCPVCGSDIVETKKGYTCKSCGFVIWKEIARRKMPQRECKSLCDNGMTTSKLDGFTSKKGTRFSCWLYLDDTATTRFDFSDDGEKARDNYVTRNLGHGGR